MQTYVDLHRDTDSFAPLGGESRELSHALRRIDEPAHRTRRVGPVAELVEGRERPGARVHRGRAAQQDVDIAPVAHE